MRPIFSSELVKDKTIHQGDEVLLDSMKLQERGCPVGTVPIRRWTKDKFLKMTQLTKDNSSRLKPNSTQRQPGTHVRFIVAKYTISKLAPNEIIATTLIYQFTIYLLHICFFFLNFKHICCNIFGF